MSKSIKPTFPFKFALGQWVLHYKTQDVYQITGLPDEYVLECTREPAYAYRLPDGRKCVRSQVEMEAAGRFVVTDPVDGDPDEVGPLCMISLEDAMPLLGVMTIGIDPAGSFEEIFRRRAYAASERHLSGYRLMVGFSNPDDLYEAHSLIAHIKKVKKI